MGNPLSLKQTEDAFTGHVITVMAGCTHAANQRVAIQKALVIHTGELTASIGMQNYRPIALALPDRYLHRSDYPLLILTMMHRPTDHQLAVQVEHHAQKQLAFQGGNLRDVRDPFALRLKGGEVSL